VIGNGGRVPPGEVIENDAFGDVEVAGVFDPDFDGLDFYESLEGMRVQLNDAVAVGPRSAFGEIPVVGDDGANAGVRTARGGVVIRANDFNPERVHLDDVIMATPVVNVGDHLGAPAVGVLDYSFGNFKLQITQSLTGVDEGLTREVAVPVSDPDDLAIAAFNVENLDPADGAAKFQDLAELIVHNLGSPDLLSLEEVQDNNGPFNDTVVDASVTLQTLAAAIQAAGGPTYDFRQINPVDDQDGGEPGGNIRVAFLFRTDRGLSFVDRPGGGSTAPTAVVAASAGPELTFSPGRIDPLNPAFTDSRKPLAGEFTFNGRTLFVIANHFNSKGGDQPLFGRFQPPILSSEVQRLQQAQVVNDFADAIVALDPNAAIVALGDFNDFEFSPPLVTLKGTVLNDLIETLPQGERYSYVFEGNSQTLDHILVSDSLFGGSFAYDVVHVNSEFAVQASDHEPQVVQLTLWGFEEFLQPIDNLPTVNTVKAGSTVPVRFSLSGDQGLEILALGYPASFAFPCDADPPSDPLEETVGPGNSSLSYDPLTDTYTYPWKTQKSWANTCRRLVVGLADGSFHYAEFRFTR
jgi:predicted extracellular nuclease